MVLTNFECWAHGGGAVIGNGELPVNSRHMDMFNPRVVQQRLNPADTGTSPVSHISSNGYYGFSYVNAAHELGDNYQQNGITHDANNTNINNNNNNNTCVPNANDVNGMLPMMHTGMDVGVATAGAAAAFGSDLAATQRRKKRYFVSDDDYANCALLNGCDSGVGIRDVAVAGLDGCAPKRCRYDDDYAAAQYCNDFFSLPSTQIGTQSCLMDTEDIQQQQQPQVDVNNGAANLTNQTTNSTSNTHYNTTQQHDQLWQQQQQQQVINASNYQQQNAAQTPPVVVYQQQHTYQGHLHRANRDVSRCLLSHMI
uniref:Uncharacterized protein n=1 Tax=Bactrocera dorsalis TaxID=27457 RepID=A0A034WAT1_BACDO